VFTTSSGLAVNHSDMSPPTASESRIAASLALALILVACATAPPGPIGPRAPSPQPIAGPMELPAKVIPGVPPLQCVPFAREVSGIAIYGDAHTWWRQAEGRYRRGLRPEPGAVLVMQGYQTTARGHVAVVTAVRDNREILVDQANWLNRGEVSVRVPVLDVSPRNDWSEVRVWHIPSGQWGARVYVSEGFIFPN
jgi:hypothetical protein